MMRTFGGFGHPARSGMQREQGCRCGRRVPGISPVARKSFSFDNFELVSIVPDVAKLVMAESPGITVTVPETVTYGDEFTLVTNEHGLLTIALS